MRLHLRLRNEKLEPLRLFNLGVGPLTCLTTPPVMPQSRHVYLLRLLVLQMCALQPALAFLEVVLDWEFGIGAHWAKIFSRRQAFTRICRFASLIVGISACQGIKHLVEHMNPKAKGQNLDAILTYCRSYVLAMNLVPMLLSLIPATDIWGQDELSNGEVLTKAERDTILKGVFVLLGALLCARNALKAFPVDETTYPELFRTQKTESMLPQVKCCPFCGSSDLLAVDQRDGAGLECQACHTSGLPLTLEVRTPSRRRATRLNSGAADEI